MARRTQGKLIHVLIFQRGISVSMLTIQQCSEREIHTKLMTSSLRVVFSWRGSSHQSKRKCGPGKRGENVVRATLDPWAKVAPGKEKKQDKLLGFTSCALHGLPHHGIQEQGHGCEGDQGRALFQGTGRWGKTSILENAWNAPRRDNRFKFAHHIAIISWNVRRDALSGGRIEGFLGYVGSCWHLV